MVRGPLEREDELALLGRAVADAESGTGGAILVEGVAGIGKTALLEEVRRAAELDRASRTRTLAARGAELEGDFAFGVVRQLLEPVLEAASEADRERLLGGAAAPARAVFTIASGEAVDSDTDYDMLHALYVLTARLAGEQPLLIAVDDAHWADLPSLRFITFLTHRIDALPAVVIVGARPRVEWRAVERYDVLTADDSIPIIRPRPLSRAAATELADAVAEGPVDDTFADACYQASGGNPFYLRALLREVGQRGLEPTADQAAEVQRLGPEAVRRSVLARLRRLSPDAGAFAGAAAVLGERAAQRIVAELAGLPAERAVAAGDELRAVGILEPGMGIEFEHPIVRTAVYELHSTGERAAAHAQAASILLAAGAPNDVVAAQLLLAEPAGSSEAVDVLRAAAREASGRGAPDVAAVYLGRALAEGAPGDARAAVVMELGLAETMRRTPTAREHLTEAIELATDPNERLRAGIALWSTDSFDGRRAEGVAKLEETLARSADADPDLRLRVEIEIARELRASLDTAVEGRKRVDELAAREWDPALPTHRMALSVIGLDALFTGRSADTLSDYADAAMPPAGSHFDESQLSPIPYYLLVYCDRVDEARALLDGVIEDSERRGSMLGAEIGSLWRSMVHLRTGALPDAEADARRVIDAAPESRWEFGLIAATHFLAEVLLERGEIDAARTLYGGPRELPRRGWASIWAYGVAKVEFEGGHAREALDALLEVGRREEEFVADRPWMLPWRSAAAVAAVTAGEPDLALRLAEEDVEVARTFGRPRPVGVALRARGIVRGGSDGIADLTEAVELLADSPARLEHARALIDLGALLRRSGDRATAREHLTTGLDRASRCGASALAERARSELQATGVRPRRERMSGPAALTGSELRVARLAASGASNREIAQTLFVTQKTVEKHLANSYAKLEIPSRERLAAALAEE